MSQASNLYSFKGTLKKRNKQCKPKRTPLNPCSYSIHSCIHVYSGLLYGGSFELHARNRNKKTCFDSCQKVDCFAEDQMSKEITINSKF